MKSGTKNIITISIVIFSILYINNRDAFAGPGDTIHVQTFTFGSPQDAWFKFPSDSIRIEKVLMNYTLKCNSAQNPACGEWDYLTYTFLYEHTGKLDSNLLSAPSYIADGSSPDSLKFMKQPSWSYYPHFNNNIVYTDTNSINDIQIGSGLIPYDLPFKSSQPILRTQYLWKASELISAGLSAGYITGIKFNIATSGSILNNLFIRMTNSNLDSLAQETIINNGFTDVFSNNLPITGGGWKTINFTTPFNWNGTSNIIVDISFTNDQTGSSSTVYSDYTSFKSVIASADKNKSLFFNGADYVTVPFEAFSAVDSFITISFWQYGSPQYQPQNQSTFEASDSAGNRVLNAHIPWSDGNVYWDAGNIGGSYDRISKAANANDYKGNWRHWTFTKNVIAGTLKVYLNGHLWCSGTAKTKLMKNIRNFKIGSFSNGTYNYDGNIDDFRVWNKELDSATIKNWMYSDLNSSHPYSSNLLFNYKFNDNSIFSAEDSSGNNYTGVLTGPPVYAKTAGRDIFKNFISENLRPNIVFEQGSFVSHIDTLVTVDSIQKQPYQIVFFNDSLNPLTPSDTMTVWPTYYNNYIFNNHGIATDSSFVFADSTIRLKRNYYYSDHFEVINPYELGRYITPYGNGLSLGNGFKWVFDVSDYRMLLKDSVHLSAGNWQELLDMSFDLIEGTPPRDPIAIKNLWRGYPSYNTGIENFLKPMKIKIPDNAINTRIKMRPTGHGFGGNENCAEFCAKNHIMTVNGVERFRRLVWKEDCGRNPVYPQGGTWVYSRANWCPGDDVPTFNFELTPFVTPGDSVTLDYNVDPYTWNGQGSVPTYVIETQLISYSAPNFTNDASVYDIKSPSKEQRYSRLNPICNFPVIVIQNTGKDTLRSLDILYGLEGAIPSTYTWTGKLAFMDTVDVKLGKIDWNIGDKVFYATVSNPNNHADEYQYNNSIRQKFSITPELPSGLIFEFKSNSYPAENEYSLTDDNGNIIFSRNSFTANSYYRDTVNLPMGCYYLRLIDYDDDGLSFWANSDGSGYMRIKKLAGGIAKNFGGDFGSEIFYKFTVGYSLFVEENEEQYFMDLFPNPASGVFNVDVSVPGSENTILYVFDVLGNKVFEKTTMITNSDLLTIDLSSKASGIYFVTLKTDKKTINRKIIISR
jgi:hypothetical protein